MIRLVADSSCDVYTFKDVDFRAVPLTISTDDGQSFLDDSHLDVGEMVQKLHGHRGRSYTACPSVAAWLEAFEGADTIYAVTITSGLSGSYNSARVAADLYQQAKPEASVHVFDSLSTGPEELLLLEKLRELVARGLGFDEVVAQAEGYKEKTRLFFSLHNLHNLAQNGRISKVAAVAVGVMNIRIIGTASPEGTLATIGKARGDRKAAAELLDQMVKAGWKGGKVRITHVQNEAVARSLCEHLRTAYPEADITLAPAGGLCSYYAEKGSLMIGVEIG